MVGSDSSLYSDTKQRNFFEQKNVKKKQNEHMLLKHFQVFIIFYHVKILDYINRKLQLTDKIKKTKLKKFRKT